MVKGKRRGIGITNGATNASPAKDPKIVSNSELIEMPDKASTNCWIKIILKNDIKLLKEEQHME